MNRISEEDFSEWLDNPITLKLIKLLKEEAHAHRSLVANGAAMDSNDFTRIGEKYFSLINTAMVYENLLENLTYDNVIEEYNDNGEIQASRESTSDREGSTS